MKFVAKIGSFLLGVIIGIVLVVGGVAGAGYVIVTRPGMVGVISEKIPAFNPSDEIKEKSLLDYGKNIYAVISDLSSKTVGDLEDAIGYDLTGLISEAIGISKSELRNSAVSGDGLINTVMNSETFTMGSLLEKFSITLPDMPLFQSDEFKGQSIGNAFTYLSEKLDFEKLTVGDLETEFGVSLGEMFSSDTLKNSTLANVGEAIQKLELREILSITTLTDSDKYADTHVVSETALTEWKTGKTAYAEGSSASFVYDETGNCDSYFDTEKEQQAFIDDYNAKKADGAKQACDKWDFFVSNNNLYLAMRPYFTEGKTDTVDYDILKTWLVNNKYKTAEEAAALDEAGTLNATLSAFPVLVAPVAPAVVSETDYNATVANLEKAEKETNAVLKYMFNAKIGADSGDPQSINGIMNDIRVSDVTEITADSPAILRNLSGLKVSELGGQKTTDVINATRISDVLGIKEGEKAESQVLQYFIDNKVTVGGMDQAMADMTLSDVTVIDETSHSLLQKLKDSKINDVAKDMTDVVNTSALYELVAIETPATIEYYKARYAASEADVEAYKSGKTAYTDGATAFDYFNSKAEQTAWIKAQKEAEPSQIYYDRYEIATQKLVFATEVDRKARYVELWLANKNSTDTAAAETAYDGLSSEKKDEFGLVITEEQYAKPYAPEVKAGYSVPVESNKTLVYLYHSKIGSDGADGLNAYMNAMRLSDVITVGESDNAILKKVKDDKVNDLSGAITDAVKTTTVGEIIGGEKDSQTRVLQYLWDANLSEGEGGLNSQIDKMTLGDAVAIPGYVKNESGAGKYVCDETTDPTTGEVVSRTYCEKATDGADDGKDTYDREDGFNIIMWKLKDSKISEIGTKMQSTINETELGELIAIETDKTSPNYNAVLAKLNKTQVQNLSSELNTAIDDTTIGELIKITDSSPNILKALKDTKMGGLSDRIDTLTVKDVYGTQPTSGIFKLMTEDEYNNTKITEIADVLTTKIQKSSMKELKEAGLLTIKDDTWTKMGQMKGNVTRTDASGNETSTEVTAQEMTIDEFIDYIIGKISTPTVPSTGSVTTGSVTTGGDGTGGTSAGSTDAGGTTTPDVSTITDLVGSG